MASGNEYSGTRGQEMAVRGGGFRMTHVSRRASEGESVKIFLEAVGFTGRGILISTYAKRRDLFLERGRSVAEQPKTEE